MAGRKKTFLAIFASMSSPVTDLKENEAATSMAWGLLTEKTSPVTDAVYGTFLRPTEEGGVNSVGVLIKAQIDEATLLQLKDRFNGRIGEGLALEVSLSDKIEPKIPDGEKPEEFSYVIFRFIPAPLEKSPADVKSADSTTPIAEGTSVPATPLSQPPGALTVSGDHVDVTTPDGTTLRIHGSAKIETPALSAAEKAAE